MRGLVAARSPYLTTRLKDHGARPKNSVPSGHARVYLGHTVCLSGYFFIGEVDCGLHLRTSDDWSASITPPRTRVELETRVRGRGS